MVRPAAVFALIFNSENRLLVGKRSSTKAVAPEYWMPVAGRVEDGESEVDALIREVREEIDVEARPLRRLATIPSIDGSYDLYWWLVEIAGEPRIANDEFIELRWVTQEELARLLPMYPENLAIMARAFSHQESEI